MLFKEFRFGLVHVPAAHCDSFHVKVVVLLWQEGECSPAERNFCVEMLPGDFGKGNFFLRLKFVNKNNKNNKLCKLSYVTCVRQKIMACFLHWCVFCHSKSSKSFPIRPPKMAWLMRKSQAKSSEHAKKHKKPRLWKVGQIGLVVGQVDSELIRAM